MTKNTSSTEVIALIGRIGSQFPQMSFRYSFDGGCQHVVDVLPEDLFGSPAFEEAANDEMIRFGRKFPSDSLIFTCNDPVFSTDVCEFETKGEETALPASVREFRRRA